MQDLAGVAQSAMIVPVGTTIVFFMFARSGVFGGAGTWYSGGSDEYLSLIVLSQPLFAIVAAWLAYMQLPTVTVLKGTLRVIAKIIFGIVLTDWLWVLGYFIYICIVEMVNGQFGHWPILILLFAVIVVSACVLLITAIHLFPPCAIAAAIGLVCGDAFQPGERKWLNGPLVKFSGAIGYLGLLAATWIAGSVKYSGFLRGDESEKVLLTLWLVGGTIGCSTSFAALSMRGEVSIMRRRLILAAALLGFLIGLGVLFHLSTERAGGELWPPLFVVK